MTLGTGLGKRSLALLAPAWSAVKAMAPGPAAAGPVPAGALAEAWPADAFVDSVGVNVHLGSPPYQDAFPTVARQVLALGVRHLRDELRPGNDLSRWASLHAQGGVRSHLLVSPTTNTVAEMLDYLRRLGVEKVSGIEGQNEGDSPWFTAQPAAGRDWAASVVAYQEAVFHALRARYPGSVLPVLSPTVLDYKPDHMRLLRPAAGFCDIVAVHPYPQGQQEPETGEDYAGLGWYRRIFAAPFKPDAPVMATEAGYHTAAGGVSPAAQARYLPRLLLHAFSPGFARTFLYELMDEGTSATDPEEQYGLLRVTGEPKPAFHALRLLLGALADPGSALAIRPAPVLLLEGPEDGRLLPFVRRNGDLVVAFWRAARSWDQVTRSDITVAPRPIRLRLLQTVRDASMLLLCEGEEWTPCAPESGVLVLPARDTVTLLRLRP